MAHRFILRVRNRLLVLVSLNKTRLSAAVSLCCLNQRRTLTPVAADLTAPSELTAFFRCHWLPTLACLNPQLSQFPAALNVTSSFQQTSCREDSWTRCRAQFLSLSRHPSVSYQCAPAVVVAAAVVLALSSAASFCRSQWWSPQEGVSVSLQTALRSELAGCGAVRCRVVLGLSLPTPLLHCHRHRSTRRLLHRRRTVASREANNRNLRWCGMPP